MFDGVPEADLRKITSENAAKLFQFDKVERWAPPARRPGPSAPRSCPRQALEAGLVTDR
jgi:hypothetical protein